MDNSRDSQQKQWEPKFSWYQCFKAAFAFVVVIFTPILYGLRDMNLGLGNNVIQPFNPLEFAGAVLFVGTWFGLCFGTVVFGFFAFEAWLQK